MHYRVFAKPKGERGGTNNRKEILEKWKKNRRGEERSISGAKKKRKEPDRDTHIEEICCRLRFLGHNIAVTLRSSLPAWPTKIEG